MLDGQAVGANLCKGIIIINLYIKHMHAVNDMQHVKILI